MSIPYREEIDNTIPKIGTFTADAVSYEQFVCALVKERGDHGRNLEHMVIGICGEAGEIADCIKKHTIYGKEFDRANAVEELGDLEFYMAGLRQMLGISRDETLEGNYEKLKARYTGGTYSDAAAIERADKKEPQPELQVIDMSKAISDDQVAAVDETAGLAKAPESP